MSHACRPASTRFRQPANSNAAGADWIYGLFGDNPPPIVVESCTFMNFPPQSPRQSAAVGLRATRAAGAAAATPPVSMARVLFDASFTSAWPLARFENASSRVAMAGCILPSAPTAPDFSPDLQEDVLATNSPVARTGFPLEGSPAALLGVGAFAPLADDPAADADADGLMNLHEYWASCDPLTPDGSNTLLSVATRSINDRLVGKNPTNALNKFVNYQANGTNGMFIPNTNCWTYGIDTSCASMWNSHQGRFRAGTLISPRHMIFAHHFAIGPGQHMVFLGTDLNVYTNTIASTRRIMGTDVLIASLQSEVDTTVIRPAKILPPNFQDYIGPGRHLPVLRFDQDERCIVCEISRNVPFLATSPTEAEESIMTSRPLSDFLQTFHAPTRDLDSGNPCFMLVEDQVVLLGTLHWRWNGTGGDSSSSVPFVTHYATEIQAAMDELAPGYALDFLDVAHYLPMQQGAL